MTQSDRHRVVILDTDQNRRDYLRSIVSEFGHTPFLFEQTSSCLDNISPLNPDLVISGSLSMSNTFRFINILKSTHSGLPVVIISDNQAIVDFVSSNGFEDVAVVDERSNPSAVQGTIHKILDDSQSCQPRIHCPLIIGNSLEIVKIKKLIPELNRMNETILIQGEPGTGKDLVARVIHTRSGRNDKPFVKLNVKEMYDELPGDIAHSQVPKNHSGTEYDPAGLFNLANSGTLFLDAIEAMRADFQARFLHFFERNDSRGPGEKKMNVRVIAAAGNNLEALVERGQFRKDLYYRLNAFKIEIPPLRKRAEDIYQLTDFFTDKYCGDLSKSYYKLNDRTKELFCNYYWPGNVRELENLVSRIVFQGKENEVADKLFLHYENGCLVNNFEGLLAAGEIAKVRQYVEASASFSLKDVGQKFLNRFEKKVVKKALDSTNWNRRKAAVMLDISYKSLLNKIKDYNLSEVR